MIVKEELLSKLRRYFDINLYEVKLWTALLSRGVSTAGELSDIADVPRSRSYDVLETLEKKGFVVMKLGKPIKYIAVPPAEVLERVKKKIKEESDKQSVIIEQLKGSEILDELNLLHTQGIDLIDPSEMSGVIKGRNNIYNHLESIVGNSKSSLSIITTEQGFLRKSDGLITHFKKAKDRGVKIRIAAPIAAEASQLSKQMFKLSNIKDSDNVRGRIVVADSNNVLFMVLDDKETHPSYDLGIWITSPFLATAMEGILDKMWPCLKQPKP